MWPYYSKPSSDGGGNPPGLRCRGRARADASIRRGNGFTIHHNLPSIRFDLLRPQADTRFCARVTDSARARGSRRRVARNRWVCYRPAPRCAHAAFRRGGTRALRCGASATACDLARAPAVLRREHRARRCAEGAVIQVSGFGVEQEAAEQAMAVAGRLHGAEDYCGLRALSRPTCEPCKPSLKSSTQVRCSARAMCTISGSGNTRPIIQWAADQTGRLWSLAR